VPDGYAWARPCEYDFIADRSLSDFPSRFSARLQVHPINGGSAKERACETAPFFGAYQLSCTAARVSTPKMNKLRNLDEWFWNTEFGRLWNVITKDLSVL
jgi:hypothetical protein